MPFLAPQNNRSLRGGTPGVIALAMYVISIPAAPEGYRGHGSAVSLPRLIVGTWHCRVLISGDINSDATGIDITIARLIVGKRHEVVS